VAHPSHFFIKYLLVSQEDVSRSSVNSTLALHGMAPVEPAYLAKLREEVGTTPEDFRPWDKSHAVTSRWLRQQRIYSFFHPDDATFEMREKVLSSPPMRRRIEGMILGNVSAREISYRLQKAATPVNDIAISEYQHYFWNPEKMGLEDWSAYFDLDQGEEGTGRTAVIASVYKLALNGGADVALYRMGVKRELDRKTIMLELQEELYYTFLETKTLPLSPKKVEMLTNLTRALSRVDDQLRSSDTTLHDVLKKFERFKVLSDQATVPRLIDLAPTGTVSQRSRTEIMMSKESPDADE